MLDTADTSGSLDSGDHDVTGVSPAWSPGVSDDVVALSVLVSISNSGDGVIEVGSALGRVEDTTGVTLEGSGVSFDGDGNWSLSNGGQELAGRVGWDVGV